MDSDDYEQTKVVRFVDYTEKQNIQWDDQGKPLYSSGRYNTKYLDENRNFDICVADNRANAVVVVSAAGKPRFRYTGRSFSFYTGLFCPYHITTDNWGNILISDVMVRIHIINQDGHFLCFIRSFCYIPGAYAWILGTISLWLIFTRDV